MCKECTNFQRKKEQQRLFKITKNLSLIKTCHKKTVVYVKIIKVMLNYYPVYTCVPE